MLIFEMLRCTVASTTESQAPPSSPNVSPHSLWNLSSQWISLCVTASTVQQNRAGRNCLVLWCGVVRMCWWRLVLGLSSAIIVILITLCLMSEAQLHAFWDAVAVDASLQKILRASIDGEIDTPLEVSAVVAIAREAGFSITPADLLHSDPQRLQVILELNDDDLEKVTGLIRNR